MSFVGLMVRLLALLCVFLVGKDLHQLMTTGIPISVDDQIVNGMAALYAYLSITMGWVE